MPAGDPDVIFIERLAPDKPTTDTATWHYVDCGLVYQGTPQTVFSGLLHLGWREVAILADGKALPNQVVEYDGTLTLPQPASIVHVGLPYVSDMAPMGLSADLQDGTSQSRLLQVTGVFLRLQDTIGGKVGPDAARLDRVETGDTLFSGLVKANIASDYIIGATVWYRQDAPFPATILAMLPEVTIGG